MKAKFLRLFSILAVCGLLFGFPACQTEGGDEGKNSKPTYYTVSFNSNGGTFIEAQLVESGKKAVKPAAPARAGYTFSDWYNGNTIFSFSTAITANITLTAKWSAAKTEENSAAGSGDSNGSTTDGTNTNSNTNSQADDSKNKCIVMYSSVYDKENVPDILRVPYDTVLTAEQLPELNKEGMIFKGWYDSNILVIAGKYTVVQSYTYLYAEWELAEYSVKFETDHATAPKPLSMYYGLKFRDYEIPPLEAEGYQFEGWYDGDTLVNDIDYVVTHDVTLVAKWKANIHTVKYESQFGIVPNSMEVDYGTVLDESNFPSLSETNYAFGGWIANNQDIVESTYTVTEDVIFTAKWEVTPYGPSEIGEIIAGIRESRRLILGGDYSGSSGEVNIGKVARWLRELSENYPDVRIDLDLSRVKVYETKYANGTTIYHMSEDAFLNCTCLSSVILPDGLTDLIGLSTTGGGNSIGGNFYGCTNLESVVIPESCTFIGGHTFAKCGLKTFTVPKNVTYIGKYVFYGCENMTDLFFEDTETPWYTATGGYWTPGGFIFSESKEAADEFTGKGGEGYCKYAWKKSGQ